MRDRDVELFEYPRQLRIIFAVGAPMVVFFPLMVAALGVAARGRDAEFWEIVGRAAHPLGLGWAWGGLLLCAALTILAHRPVRVSDRGIETLLLSFLWRSVSWDTLKRVDKRIDFDTDQMETIQTIVFQGRTQNVSIRSSIQNFEVLRERINFHLQKYETAVSIVDCSGLRRVVSEAKPGKI